MKKHNALACDKEYLRALVTDANSCVVVQEQNYHIALHPFHMNNIDKSLKDILNKNLAKYDKKLGGILLGYEDIKLVSQAGALLNDSFFIHVDITASFYLFKPECGKLLMGTVNKKSNDHVGCLVHKTFNVALPKPQDAEDRWIGSRAEIGQEITFKITFMNLEARLPYIRAEFVSICGDQDSGISTGEENDNARRNTKLVFDSNSENEDSSPSSKKKKPKENISAADEQVYNADETKKTEALEVPRKKNKHKKKTSFDAEETVLDSSFDTEKVEDLNLNAASKKSKGKDSFLDVEMKNVDVNEFLDMDQTDMAVKKSKKKSKRKDASQTVLEKFDSKNDYLNTSKKSKKKSKEKDHFIQPEAQQEFLNINSVDTVASKRKSKHKDSSFNTDVGKKEDTSLNVEEEKIDDDDDYQSTSKKSKKKSKEKNNSLELGNKNEFLNDDTVDIITSKKKSKHKDSSSNVDVELEYPCQENIQTITSKSKKKSRHKSTTSDNEIETKTVAVNDTTKETKTRKRKSSESFSEPAQKKHKSDTSMDDLRNLMLQQTLLSLSTKKKGKKKGN